MVAHLDHCFQVELELRILVYVEEGKPEDLEKNPQEQGREQPQTQPTCDIRSGSRVKPQLLVYPTRLISYLFCFLVLPCYPVIKSVLKVHVQKMTSCFRCNSRAQLGSVSVSGQLPTYPSPNPTLTLTCYQLTVVELGEG